MIFAFLVHCFDIDLVFAEHDDQCSVSVFYPCLRLQSNKSEITGIFVLFGGLKIAIMPNLGQLTRDIFRAIDA